MTESQQPLNPDPPWSPGTPEPPDLDVDVSRFVDDDDAGERPDDEDVTPEGEEPA